MKIKKVLKKFMQHFPLNLITNAQWDILINLTLARTSGLFGHLFHLT